MISRYDCPLISCIWTDASRYRTWMQIEFAFLEAYRGVHVDVPDVFLRSWIQRIARKEAVLKHDVAAFVEWLEEYLYPLIGDEARFVHYGLTSSDILDTAFSLQVRASNAVIGKLITQVCTTLCNCALDRPTTSILGRTHGQVAEVILLRQKFCTYSQVLDFHAPADEEPYYGRFCGSVGNHKYFPLEVEEEALYRLGLAVCDVNDGQVINRSIYARYMNTWAIIASVIEKIATDLRLLAQTEIAELLEGFAPGQVGSSSMPHKRNPILSENLCGLARVIRGYQTTAMQNIALWNERDISHSSAERIIFPDAVITLGFMLERLNDIFQSLVVNDEQIVCNLLEYQGQTKSQERMLTLIRDGLSRKEAHTALRQEQIH